MKYWDCGVEGDFVVVEYLIIVVYVVDLGC